MGCIPLLQKSAIKDTTLNCEFGYRIKCFFLSKLIGFEMKGSHKTQLPVKLKKGKQVGTSFLADMDWSQEPICVFEWDIKLTPYGNEEQSYRFSLINACSLVDKPRKANLKNEMYSIVLAFTNSLQHTT